MHQFVLWPFTLSWHKLDWSLRWTQQNNCQMCPGSFSETLLLTCLLSYQQRTPWFFLSFASTTLQFLQQVSSVDQFRWQGPLHPGAPAGCTCKTSDALFTSALTVSDKCRLHMSYLQIEVKTLLIFHHWDSLL